MRVLPDTAQDHLARHLRRLARNPEHASYDLVIVDPPAFGVGRGNERVLRLLWPDLFASLRTMTPRQLVLMSNDKAFRSRQDFGELVQAQLGDLYRFERLGTHLTPDDLAADRPTLPWTAGGRGSLLRRARGPRGNPPGDSTREGDGVEIAALIDACSWGADVSSFG